MRHNDTTIDNHANKATTMHESMKTKRTILFALMTLCTLSICAMHNIPTVYIDTHGQRTFTSRDQWTDSVALRIVMPNGSVAYSSINAQAKLRGHSTFAKPKKPYAIKLDAKQSLLGMMPSKRWVLLANFMDHSNLRNRLALTAAKQTRLDWTPDSRFVDVVVNGRLQGLYLLCEQVEVADNKVAIDKNNGWLVEGDNYDDGDPRITTTMRKLPFNIKSPKKPTTQQTQAIAAQIDGVEKAIYGRNGGDLSELIDLDSFADWWLIHELGQNAEPNGPRSCYMHKAENGLIRMGPVWDFDLAFITVGLDSGGDLRPARLNRTDVKLLTGDSIYNANALWYDGLLRNRLFKRHLLERWKELKPKFESVADSIGQWEKLIEPSAMADENLWQGQDPARFDIHTTFKSSVRNLKQTYLYRIEAMERLLNR